jgi:hypothetical protein
VCLGCKGLCVFGLQGSLRVWAASVFVSFCWNSLCIFLLQESLFPWGAGVLASLGCKSVCDFVCLLCEILCLLAGRDFVSCPARVFLSFGCKNLFVFGLQDSLS